MHCRTLIPTSVVALAACSLLVAACGSNSPSCELVQLRPSTNPGPTAARSPTSGQVRPLPALARSDEPRARPDIYACQRVQRCALGRSTIARVPVGIQGLRAPAAERPAKPTRSSESSADRRAAGVRPVPAQPRVPELPRPDEQRPNHPPDARQRRDKPESASDAAGRRRVRQRHPRATHQGRRGPLRRGTIDRGSRTHPPGGRVPAAAPPGP